MNVVRYSRMRAVSSRIVALIVIIVVALAVVTYLAYLGTGKTTTGPLPVQILIPSGAQNTPSGWNNSHLISSAYFNPATITVVIGVNSTVIWRNNDSTNHTVSSFVTPAGAPSFSSPQIQPGGSYSYTFTVPGTYQYYCYLHPWMGGQIIVISGS
jgi:plastocyanin